MVNLLPEMSREILRGWRRTTRFYCPQCKMPVHLKIGDVVIPHFAHQKDSACSTSFSEGESDKHLQGKQQLFLFFKRSNFQVELEPFLNQISQRPDILVRTPNKQIPIEFQCSIIPTEDIETRTAGYRSAGMKPIWILHTPPKFKHLPQGVGTWQFNRFHEQFFNYRSPEDPVLLTYHPDTNFFHYFSSLIHVAGKRYIGIHRKLPITSQVFPFANPKRPLENELHEYVKLYQSMRFRFLQTRVVLNRKGVNNVFLRQCYELRIPPTELPSWIGVPSARNHSFRVHDCEWQLDFVHFLRRLQLAPGGVSMKEVYKFVSRFEGDSKQLSEACTAYCQKLVAWGVEIENLSIDLQDDVTFSLIAERFLAKRYEN